MATLSVLNCSKPLACLRMFLNQWRKNFRLHSYPLITLVDQILTAKKHAPEGFNQGKDMDSRFHGNDGAVVTADTSALERQIDEMVYELYGLTDDEIAIVEWEGVTMQIKYSKHIE